MVLIRRHLFSKEMSVRGAAFLFYFFLLSLAAAPGNGWAKSDPSPDTLPEQDLLAAMSLCDMGEWGKALALFKKALAKNPGDTNIYLRMVRLNNLIKSMGFSSRKGAARKEQKKFIGTGSEAKLLLDGVRLHVEGRSAEAMTLLHYVQTYRRHDELLNNLIRHVISSGKLDVEAEPADPEKEVKTKLKAVEALFSQKRYDEALEACQELVRLAPDLAIARTRLGSIYYALGDQVSARREYDNALQLNPNDEMLRGFMRSQRWLE